MGIYNREQESLSWQRSRPICGLARGLLFVNVSISCVLRNVELFNLNFPRCAEAPLSLGPAALPCPWHKAITQTQSHTGHAGAAAVRIAPQGNGKNIAPGRQNKSYNELPLQTILTRALPKDHSGSDLGSFIFKLIFKTVCFLQYIGL